MKSTPPSQRSLYAAWKAGRHALLHDEILPPHETCRKRPWRPVNENLASGVFLIRGLKHLGEVKAKITDGDKVVCQVLATGRQLSTFKDNLLRIHSGVVHTTSTKKPKPGTPRSTVKKADKILADLNLF